MARCGCGLAEEVPVHIGHRHKLLGGEPAGRLRCRREWQPHSRHRGENPNERAHYMSRNQALQALMPGGLKAVGVVGDIDDFGTGPATHTK